MILQALVTLYDDLLACGAISRPGWSKMKIGYALCVDEDGILQQVIPLVTEKEGKNGKPYLANQELKVPCPVKRSSGISANFLCDNSGYILGIDDKGKPERTRKCYEACKALHLQLLSGIKNETAQGIVNFFLKWEPLKCDENAALFSVKDDLLKGANLVFRVNGQFAHENSEIQNAWDAHYSEEQGPKIRCLVSGELDELALVHPALKGVNGAQSSGAALVSFNAPAFCSYQREQGANATIGKKAAFAYTTSLNHLLADRDNVQQIGDTTVVCWADGAEPQYQSLALSFLFGQKTESSLTDDELHAIVCRLADGKPCSDLHLDPKRSFYILGLAPNAARLSVRFFLRSTFGDLMRNVNAHHERMRIVGSRFSYVPLWALLRETANQNAKDKSPSPVLSGSVARAIFSGTRYPAALLEATMLRIRAEREITPGRAAILKAYYLKNPDDRCPKEVLTVSLNENSTNIPYTLGRLFAVYEAAQERANPGVNATIKDRYFNAAATTPAIIFPVLDNLYHHHIKKLEPGQRVYFEKQVGALTDVLGESFPTRFGLPEQGAFQLGYYHQKQKRFEKKEN